MNKKITIGNEECIMVKPNEIEEIISLIHKGVDLELLSFELDIPMEKLQEYKKRLELRKFAKKSIKKGRIIEAIQRLDDFIKNTDNSIIEKTMLLKLKSYANGISISEENLKRIEEERKKIGFSSTIDEVLEDLEVQIPKIKSGNIRKQQKNIAKDTSQEEYVKKCKINQITKK